MRQPCFAWVFSILIFATAPAGAVIDTTPVVTGDSVLVHWKAKPRAVFWLHDDAASLSAILGSSGEIVVPRSGLGSLPTELAVIPENPRLRPKIIHVSTDQKQVEFVTEPAAGNEIWLWGSGHVAPGPSELVVICPYMNWSAEQNTQGAFLVQLKRSGMTRGIDAFSVGASRLIQNIRVDGLHRETGKLFAACRIYTDTCAALFVISPNDWGRSYHVEFDPHSGMKPSEYPI